MMKYYIKKWIKQDPLLSFFIIAYASSWLFTIPFVYVWREICSQRLKPWHVIFLPGAYGPTIAALIVVAITEKKIGVKKLLLKLKLWHISLKWYALALFFPVFLYALSIALSSFQKEALTGFKFGKFLTSIPIYLLAALPFGPLAEELGWRGFALPRLLQRHSPLKASIYLGIIWTFWHTPLFWYPGAAIPTFLKISFFSILFFLGEITAETILFTFLYINTKGSVLLAIIFHLTFNTSGRILLAALPEPTIKQELEIYLIYILLMWLVAILSLVFYKYRAQQEVHL